MTAPTLPDAVERQPTAVAEWLASVLTERRSTDG